MRRRIPRACRSGRWRVELAQQAGHAKDAPDLVVQRVAADRSGFDRVLQLNIELHAGPGHFQVLSAVGRADGIVYAAPIRNREAAEAPFAFEDLVDQEIVGRAVQTVQLVVGRHDGPRVGLLHRRLERGQVDFAQDALVDLDVDGEPIPLLVVAREVFRGRADAPALDTFHVAHGDPRSQIRVFAERLEVAPVERRAADVDAGPQQDVEALAARFLGQRNADALHQFGIPGRRHADAGGEATALAAVAHAVRTVGDLDAGNSERRNRMRHPRVLAGHHGDLVIQSHLIEETLDTIFLIGRPNISSGERKTEEKEQGEAGGNRVHAAMIGRTTGRG